MATHEEAGTLVHDEDLEGVRAWFTELAALVRAVDFVPARRLVVEDFIAFGTITDFMVGQQVAEMTQWRKVWPSIDGFTFRDDIRALVSPDRLFAVGLAVFDSTGYHEDGSTFVRAGRATVSLIRGSITERWVANHTHMSLYRGTPPISFGNKPSKS
ncbi:ketosteroid isomerase [Kaistia algarum]|uniref:ketosteroid isomerase n=1 Tax=Kaistia algarum TaxID=2083279 RepID=UPI000CE8E58B|nr:ketosteroid isomerase [Kaistia algarum]MCX5514790.1 ketosteroid isomerase [Kaistia algarum]PPE79554.1 ketosteroid isomerase [Kaistia algarum]